MEDNRYTYRITWSAEDQEFVGLCAELPSLSWLAPTQAEAFDGIRRVVAEVVADLNANGEPVPDPIATRSYSGRIMLRVPPEVHRDLVIQAAEEGVSINRLLNARIS